MPQIDTEAQPIGTAPIDCRLEITYTQDLPIPFDLFDEIKRGLPDDAYRSMSTSGRTVDIELTSRLNSIRLSQLYLFLQDQALIELTVKRNENMEEAKDIVQENINGNIRAVTQQRNPAELVYEVTFTKEIDQKVFSDWTSRISEKFTQIEDIFGVKTLVSGTSAILGGQSGSIPIIQLVELRKQINAVNADLSTRDSKVGQQVVACRPLQ